MGRRDPKEDTASKGDLGLLFALTRRIHALPAKDRPEAARILRALAAPEVWDDEHWTDHDFALRLMLVSAASTAESDD